MAPDYNPNALVAFSALTLLVGRKGIRPVKIWEMVGALVTSPDGVAPIRMVGVSASVNLPLHHKVQQVLFWHQLTRVVLEKGP